MIVSTITDADYLLEVVPGETGGFRGKLIPKQKLGIRYIDMYGFESADECPSEDCARRRMKQWATINGIKKIVEEK